MNKSKNIEQLRDRLQKLFFLCNLIIYSGQESDAALYFLEDEIRLAESAYQKASDELEALI